MKKEDLLSSLNKEAKKLVKTRIIIIRLVLNCIIFLLSWYWNFFSLSPDVKTWHVLFISILLLGSFFQPLWKISAEKIRYAFYEISNKRAQECVNEINRIMLGTSYDVVGLTALQEKNALLLEILSENSRQMRSEITPSSQK